MPKVEEDTIIVDGQEKFIYNHPRPSVAASCVITGIYNAWLQDLHVLLITRGNEPFKGYLALPGGFMNPNETTVEAAARETKEETQLNVGTTHMRFVGVYDAIDRDPRGRVIETAYASPLLYCNQCTLRADDDADEVGWYPIRKLKELELAFDHTQVIRDAIASMPKEYLVGFVLRDLKTVVDRER